MKITLWHKIRNRLFQGLYRTGHRKRMNWLYYTMIFGSMPIVIRFIVYLSAPSEEIAPFTVSDIAFWGIMLNTAAIANATDRKTINPDVVTSIVSVALMHIVFLVTIYCVALFPVVNLYLTGCIGAFVLVSSFILSNATTDSNFMDDLQMAFEHANEREAMHPLMKIYIDQIEERVRNGENPELGEGLKEFLETYGHEINLETMVISKKPVPTDATPDS